MGSKKNPICNVFCSTYCLKSFNFFSPLELMGFGSEIFNSVGDLRDVCLSEGLSVEHRGSFGN